MTFTSFSAALGGTVNDTGEVRFTAGLAGPGIGSGNDVGAFAGEPGLIGLFVQEGDVANNAPIGTTFSTVTRFGINNVGGGGILPDLSDGSHGLWTGTPGSLDKVARSTEAAPGTTTTFENILTGSVSDAGESWLIATLVDNPSTNSSNDAGVWYGTPGSVNLIAREGDQIVGAPAGVTYGGLQIPKFRPDGSGVIFTSNDGPSGTDALVQSDGSTTSAFLVEGDAAPGLPGVSFGDFGEMIGRRQAATDPGALPTKLTGAGITTSNDSAVYAVGPSTTPSLLLREDDPAPGAGAGVVFDDFIDVPWAIWNTPGLIPSGELTFRAPVRGTGVTSANDLGIWTGQSASLSLVAREGNQAPGLPAGVTFGELLTNPLSNSSGQLAFSATLAGPGISASNDLSLWAFDPKYGLSLVVQEGDVLEVQAGDFRTIDTLGIGVDWYDLGLIGDTSDVPYQASFTDGSEGLFLLNLDTAVAPTPLAAWSGLLVLGGLGWGAARRRSGRRID